MWVDVLAHPALLALLAFLAFLAWAAAGPSAAREHAARATGAARALVAVAGGSVARGSAPHVTDAGERGPVLASRRAARPSMPAMFRRQWLGRAADTDGGGDTALPASRAERLWDVAHGARAHVDRRPQRHLPSGEPSPYDATAPPSAARRDG